MDYNDDTFNTIAEAIFWTGMCAILAIIVGAAIMTYPDLDLSKFFWPILALGTVIVCSLLAMLFRPAKGGVNVSNNVAGGDIVGGHLYVNVDLAELNATLSANRERYGTRGSDVPVEPTQPWPRRADTSDQPWIDGKVKSKRTPDMYSRASDRKTDDTPAPMPAATAFDLSNCRDAYAEVDRSPCAGSYDSSPSTDSGCASSFRD